MHQRTVFFVSDGTGITAQSLGQLLAHFPEVLFRQIRLPFTNSVERVNDAVQQITKAGGEDSGRPIVVMSVGNSELRRLMKETDAFYIDLFSLFIDPLGEEIGQEPLTGAGIAHSAMGHSYHERMEAINFTLRQDADQPVSRHAIRHQGGQLPVDTGRFRTRLIACCAQRPQGQAVRPHYQSRAVAQCPQ